MKNKVFWIRKNNLVFMILIGIIFSLVLYFYSKDNRISFILQSLLEGQTEIILIGLSILELIAIL
ncbi:hypothetical protein BCR24_04690 [Enterococcus ureilyticus]|uniref:Uncharacterized protein n=1 Tax=Enterococcus ureilyticus TaxID=1131292 RepID=A0A1E5HAZ7_9ENTE|nr:hypothetical protein BCR24_04690 [Enterococcus ureilyticus]